MLAGGNGTGAGSTPKKASTAQYTYTFLGWSTDSTATTADSNALNNVTENRTVYAIFSETLKTYAITFVKAQEDGGGTLQTVNVAYGEMPAYTGTTPTTTKTGWYRFTGWTPALATVTGAATYTAVFAEGFAGLTRPFIARQIIEAETSDLSIVGDYVFANCYKLTSVSFPAVTKVGIMAFSGCSSLNTVYMPAVESIASQGFYACRQLTEVSFPNATYIRYNAFGGCSSLTSVSFPNVTTVETSTFAYCSRLTTIYMPLLQFTGSGMFQACSTLANISLPSVSIINDQTFSACSMLSNVYLPMAETIKTYAFTKCRDLVSVSFPMVSYIAGYAFASCSNLTTFIIGNTSSIVSLVQSTAFSGTNNAIIYVPDDLVNTYKAAANWSYYSSRIKGISELPN